MQTVTEHVILEQEVVFLVALMDYMAKRAIRLVTRPVVNVTKEQETVH